METFPLDATTLLSVAFVYALVMGLTEMVKRLLSNRITNFNDYAPLVSVLWGVVLGLLVYFTGYSQNLLASVLSGVVVGLQVSGLWDLGKRTIGNGILGRIKQ
jgi:prepilin signal peptidase PulO-like enzyme (type II secretory pathway)